MKGRRISVRAWACLGLSGLFAGLGLALPRLHPVPTGPDPELIALRAERDGLAGHDDMALARLREQAQAHPAPAWSVEQFTARVGTGWRVEWQDAGGATRTVRLTRSAPRLEAWPEYLRFVKTWTAQPGVMLESLELTAQGTVHARRLTGFAVGLRVKLAVGPVGDAERAAPSRGPLPVAAADGPAESRKVGPGPALRRPAASAQPPAGGPDSASFRPDPPGPRAGATPENTKPQKQP